MKRSRWKGGVAPRAPVPASRRRGAVTFGALVTHRTDLQPLLPQVVIGNKHVLPQALCAEVKEAVSPVVHVWAEKSGWMCERLLVKYLALVADVFDSRPACQPIVLLDCAPAHLGEAVLRVAQERGLYICFVPAGCTAQVQPVDVGCFSPLKAFLKREARDVLARKASFTKPDWLLAINKAATEFLRGRRWAPVFHQCGVIGDRTGLKGFLSTMAAKYKEVEPAPVMPSPSIISALLPRNRSISYKDLLPEQFAEASVRHVSGNLLCP